MIFSLNNYQLTEYCHKTKIPIPVRDKFLTEKKGIIIYANQKKFRGEFSYLDGVTTKEFNFYKNQLQQSLDFMLNLEVNLKNFDFKKTLLNLYPITNLEGPVLFALETLLLDILNHYLPFYKEKPVNVNGLALITNNSPKKDCLKWKQEGLSCIKIKIGKTQRDNELNYLEELFEIADQEFYFRLDGNNQFNPKSLKRYQQIKNFKTRVEYVEEPFKNPTDYQQEDFPLGLDESLTYFMQNLDKLPKSTKAFVIKPALHGITRSYNWIALAQKKGIIPVISSTFESRVGLKWEKFLASDLKTPCGLDTLKFF